MRVTALFAWLAVILVLAACGEEPRFGGRKVHGEDPEEKAIRLDIEALANGHDGRNPEASVAYDTAVNNLIMRGVKVETRVIDALRSHQDPWVRLGCVEVLTAIATKTAVEHLIAVLDDPAPLVAQRADIALMTLTGQRMIAEPGQPQGALLPAVPERDPADVALDAEERLWAAWHARHKDELKGSWQRWWTANRATFVLR